MNGVVFTAALAITMPFAVASAAGPFDGQYTGGSPSTGRQGCPDTHATVSIVDRKMTGESKFLKYSYPIAGTVAPDGTVTGKWATIPFTGKFTGTHFTGTYNSKECGTERPITLDKSG
jgi:hypothetical protein